MLLTMPIMTGISRTIADGETAYEHGTLTVSKEVVNGDEALEFNFEAALTFYNDPAAPWDMSMVSYINAMMQNSGVFTNEQMQAISQQFYNVVMNGSDPASEIIVTTTFTLKHGESVEFKSLPGGTDYTVTEAGTEGYVPSADGQTAAAGASLTVTGTIDGDKTLAFVNTISEDPTYEPGTLTVSKEVVNGDEDLEFNFDLSMTLYNDPAEPWSMSTISYLNAMREVSGIFTSEQLAPVIAQLEAYIMNDGAEPLDEINLTTTFTLKHGESVEIPLLGGATYTVTEAGTEGYVPSADGQTAAAGASLTVTGTIDGDETVAFVNTYGEEPTYEYGTLTVSKEVVNGDEEQEFSFELTITMHNDPSDPWDMSTVTYLYMLDENNGGLFPHDVIVEVANQVGNTVMAGLGDETVDEVTFTTTFTLKHGESKSIPALPGGTDYTVTEAGTEGYFATANGQRANLGQDLTVTGTIDGDATVAYKNVVPRVGGGLTVSKEVVNGDADQEFNFELTIAFHNDPDNPWTAAILSSTYAMLINSGLFTNEEASAIISQLASYVQNVGDAPDPITATTTFTLKDGESKTIPSLVGGTEYTITETGTEGYAASANGQTAAAGQDLTVTGIINGDATVAYTNTYSNTPVYEYGKLTISKAVVNGDEEQEFSFELTITMHNDPSDPWDMSTVTYLYMLDENNGGLFPHDVIVEVANQVGNTVMAGLGDETVDEVTFTTTFTLKHGESKSIPALPGGTDYTVTEAGTEGYFATANGQRANLGQDLTVTGTIDGDATVAYKNVVPRVGGGLTVSKEVVNGDADQEFNFELTIAFHNDPDNPWTAAILSSTYAMLINSGLFTNEEASAIISQLASYVQNVGDAPDPITATTTFTLKDGESKTIPSLVGGTEYTITETGTEGYAASANGQTAAAGQDLTVTGIIDGDATVAYTNTYGTIPQNGNLVIGKTVVNGDEEQEFTFTLTITLHNNAYNPWTMGTVSYLHALKQSSGGFIPDDVINEVANQVMQTVLAGLGDETVDEVTFTTTFTLKHGESKSIGNLPGGTDYTITEAGTEGYTASANAYTAAAGQDLTVTGTIDGDATVAYTNTFGDYPMFKTYTLALEGKIGVRFYMYLPQTEQFGYGYMDFQISGKNGENYATTEQFSTDPEVIPVNSKGYYGFTFYVNAIQMADTITATFHFTDNGEDRTIQTTYSAKQYFLMFDDSYAAVPEAYSENMANLIMATADLGHYVQAYLSDVRPEWSLENGDHAEMDKFYHIYTDDDRNEATEAVASHALSISGSNSDIKKMNYKVNFDKDMAIHMIIAVKPGYTGTLTATTEDGVDCVVVKQTDTKYMVEVPNVMAHQLSHKFTIHITTDSGTLTVVGSGLSYAQIMLAGADGDTLLQDAMTAFYRYSLYADLVKEETRRGR